MQDILKDSFFHDEEGDNVFAVIDNLMKNPFVQNRLKTHEEQQKVVEKVCATITFHNQQCETHD